MLKQIHSTLVNNAASILACPIKVIPSCLKNRLLLELLTSVFHEALDDGDFAFLEERWLKISISDLDIHWFVSYQNKKIVISNTNEWHDVSFSGSLNDLVLIVGRREDPDTLFFQRRLKIEGDTELGLEVKNLMDSTDFDSLLKPINQVVTTLADFVQQGMRSNPVETKLPLDSAVVKQ